MSLAADQETARLVEEAAETLGADGVFGAVVSLAFVSVKFEEVKKGVTTRLSTYHVVEL